MPTLIDNLKNLMACQDSLKTVHGNMSRLKIVIWGEQKVLQWN